MKFVPCRGRGFCTESGTHCNGCGRSHEEIAKFRLMTDQAVTLALEYDYENVEDYAGYLASYIYQMVEFRRQQAEEQQGSAG